MIINLISQLVFRSPAGLIYKTFSFVRCLCAPLFFLAFCASTVPKVSAQFYDSTKIVSEGGMIFAQRSQDTLRMSNSSVAGIRVAGSASAPGGGIKVGAASSEVLSELNPLFVSSGGIAGDLFVAGNQSDWESSAHSARGIGTSKNKQHLSQISRGKLDPRLAQLLLDIQPVDGSDEIALIESKTLVDPTSGSGSRILRFSDNSKNLQLLLAAKDASGNPSTSGVHVLQLVEPVDPRENSRSLLGRQSLPQFQAWAKQINSNKSIEKKLAPIFIPYGDSPPNDDVFNLASLQSASVTQSQTLYTILGFSRTPNPNSGKRSAIAAFASNNRTAGSVTVQPGQTLADLSARFGTTIQELMQANNLVSPDADISGFPLVIPADLSTVGFEQVLEGDTPATMAQRYNMDLSWFMDLNALNDPNQALQPGSKLRIPGRRPVGSVVLPPAKPQPPELEYADYGAYTTYDVTYNVKGSLTPLFQRNIIEVFR